MIVLDRKSPIPIHKQIVLQIKKEVMLGRLKPMDKLPPVREMAARLKVNVNTVLKALEDLTREGILESQHGKGFFVRAREMQHEIDEIVGLLGKVVKEFKKRGIDKYLGMALLLEVWKDDGDR